MQNVCPSRNYPFSKWCEAKGFTTKHGYALISKGTLQTFLIGSKRYVSEEEDERFDTATRGNTRVDPLPHRPERESFKVRAERKKAVRVKKPGPTPKKMGAKTPANHSS